MRLVCIVFASSQTVQRPGSGAPNVAQRALILVFIGTVLNKYRLDAHIDQLASWDLVGENWPLQNDSWGHEGPRTLPPHCTTIWFSHRIINPSPLGNHFFAMTAINVKSTTQILFSLPIFLQSAQLFCNFNKLLSSQNTNDLSFTPTCKKKQKNMNALLKSQAF